MLGELEFEFDRQDILARIRANREKHTAEFTDALEGYYLELADQLAVIAKEARAASKQAAESKDPDKMYFQIRATKPESHEADYDRIIDMLESASNDKIELDENEFSQYVRDEWVWKRAFTESASYYSSVNASHKLRGNHP